ncbi:MAG: group III truncated hemoglobin [Flavobacteriales bacterium]
MTRRPDITSNADVRLLIERFYGKARPDPVIGHFFTGLDRDHHIPLITSFWDMVLFGTKGYTGDPMTSHVQLHRHMPMRPEHFQHWVKLFSSTVDELFEGPKAGEAKQRATTIAAVMAHRVIGK